MPIKTVKGIAIEELVPEKVKPGMFLAEGVVLETAYDEEQEMWVLRLPYVTLYHHPNEVAQVYCRLAEDDVPLLLETYERMRR